MKKYILLLFAFGLCSVAFGQTYPKPANTIRLLTFNTHYCKGGTDPGNINDFNTERLALVISTLNPDMVSLQELDSASISRGKRNLIADIARFTKLDYIPIFGNAEKWDGGAIGCGTLVKKPNAVVKIKKIPLPGKTENRIALRVDLDEFSFISTHFDLDDAKRIQGAVIINSEIDYIRKPVFLAGDLNDSHRWGSNGGIAFPTLMDKFIIISDIEGNSIPGRPENGQALIDYILFRDYNDSGIKVVGTQIVRTIDINGSRVDLKDISDHYPVYVDIEIPGMTGIEEAVTDKALQIYPNPVNNVLNIKGIQKVNKVEIYSLTGQKVIEVVEEDVKTVDVSNLINGAYLIKALVENELLVGKVIKN